MILLICGVYKKGQIHRKREFIVVTVKLSVNLVDLVAIQRISKPYSFVWLGVSQRYDFGISAWSLSVSSLALFLLTMNFTCLLHHTLHDVPALEPVDNGLNLLKLRAKLISFLNCEFWVLCPRIRNLTITDPREQHAAS